MPVIKKWRLLENGSHFKIKNVTDGLLNSVNPDTVPSLKSEPNIKRIIFGILTAILNVSIFSMVQGIITRILHFYIFDMSKPLKTRFKIVNLIYRQAED